MKNYRRYKQHNTAPRDMYLKYPGQCQCCGAAIEKGELATYYPPPNGQGRGTVAHIGGLDGNSATCTENIRAKLLAPTEPPPVQTTEQQGFTIGGFYNSGPITNRQRDADRIDGYDRDDIGESPDT